MVICSDANFHWCPVIDWLKSRKTDCPPPPFPQDPCPIKNQFWWFCVPLFLQCCRQARYHFSTKFRPRVNTYVHSDWRVTAFWLKQTAMNSAHSKRIMWFRCHKWEKKRSKFTSENHSFTRSFFLTCADAFYGGKLSSVFQAYWFLKTHDTYVVLWFWLCLFVLPLRKRHKFDFFFLNPQKLTSLFTWSCRQSWQYQRKHREATRLTMSLTAWASSCSGWD